MPAPEVRADQMVEVASRERDVRRGCEQGALRILRDDLAAPFRAQMNDSVGAVTRDEHATVDGEGDSIRHGAAEPRYLLELAALEIEAVYRRSPALDDPQVAAGGRDRAAVREVGQSGREHLERPVGREAEDASVVGSPRPRVGEVEHAVGGERRSVRVPQAVFDDSHDAVRKNTQRAFVPAAENDPAATIDRQPEYEPRRASDLLGTPLLELYAVHLAGLSPGPQNAGGRIPAHSFRVIESVDEDLNHVRDRPRR